MSVKKPAFIINNRNKAKFVYRAVAGALAQTVPCHIIVADFASTDNSRDEIRRAINTAPPGADHFVQFYEKDEPTEASMVAVNRAIAWMVEQTDAEWVFQCSSDDYSLPRRVEVCMQAAANHECAGVATTMRFEAPGRPEHNALSGYPTESGYVTAGTGVMRLAYGSTIWSYRRDFLKKVGLDVPCTLDVYLGYLAALDKGYYVVAEPHHVHYMAEDNDNIGFQGKMRAAERSGDKATITRINELNRFQLFELYFQTKLRQQQLYPMAHPEDQNALLNMMISQACGWYAERKRLHEEKTTPWIM